MPDILLSALPEFLGSLCAGLVIAAGTWTARRLRARRADRTGPDAPAVESLPPGDGHAGSASRPHEEAQ
ncbi:hypothetical protein [Streptomyces sp. NPDC088915]|uniref:hypothetical protein n=1 Tax=Streptomyces sp. NPDC088915 TaxID=3365912 RepID=UPI00382CC68D